MPTLHAQMLLLSGRMHFLLCTTLLLAALCVDAGKQGSVKMKAAEDHGRIIVRFRAEADRSKVEAKVLEFRSKVGVTSAISVPSLRFAIVHVRSLESEEALYEDFALDPDVELAMPDSWVKLNGLRRASQAPAQAPPRLGHFVALKSWQGKFISAAMDGSITANKGKLDDWETFQLKHHSDSTFSLLSFHGKYVSAEGSGGLVARQAEMGEHEKFTFKWNADGTVSIFSPAVHKYFTAKANGAAAVDRIGGDSWDRFTMIVVGGAQRRFPDDPLISKLWAMHSDSGGCDVSAVEAWAIFSGNYGSGVTVGVVDTGIDYNHEDLAEQMWVNLGEIPRNGIDDDGNGVVDDVYGADFVNDDGDPFDDSLHGTHVAGTIGAAGNNGKGVSGLAWKGVKLMALKFLDSQGEGRLSDAIRSMEYGIANGARILSNSWGGEASSSALRVAIERAGALGVLFVAAAGNTGEDNDEVPHFPSGYSLSNVISVAASQLDGSLADFSCYGHSVDVAAPGADIFSTVPGNGYSALSGTSMACPHVSGLAALLWLYRPGLSLFQLKEIILKSVFQQSSLMNRTRTAGVVNAFRALQLASAVEVAQPPAGVARGITFLDAEPRPGVINGVVTILAAENETGISFYTVCFLSKSGHEVGVLGSAIATGAPVLQLWLNASMAVPRYATQLIALAGNLRAMQSPISGAPRTPLIDIGTPELNARGATWVQATGGDTYIVLTRAADESSISHYNIYWSNSSCNDSALRGTLIGQVKAIDFHAPPCEGIACERINMSASASGFVYTHIPYGIDEQAEYSVLGPGYLRLLGLDTEPDYDYLEVDSTRISGKLTAKQLPQNYKLQPGRMKIRWASDLTVTGRGWSFELIQAAAEAKFVVPAEVGRVIGSSCIEVVAAYHLTELPGRGIWVTGASDIGGFASLMTMSEVRTAPVTAGGYAENRSRNFDQEPKQSGNESMRSHEVWSFAATNSSLFSPHLLSAVTIFGLNSTFLAGAEGREGLQLTLQRALGAELEVVLWRLLHIDSAAGAAEGGRGCGVRRRLSEEEVAARVGPAAKVEFLALPSQPLAEPMRATVLDRAEAQLLILCLGGKSTDRFDTELAAAFGNVSAENLQTFFTAPTLLVPRPPLLPLPHHSGRGLEGSLSLAMRSGVVSCGVFAAAAASILQWHLVL